MDRLSSMSSFVQVVDTRSFSGAARQLKLSQATVTGHVQSLEQQLGIRLLNRTTRKVSLTDEGTQFYQRCSRVLAEVGEIENLARSLQQAPSGRLRLNTDVTLARAVAPVVGEYVQIYPEVSIELIMTDQIGRSRSRSIRSGNSCRFDVEFQPDPAAAWQRATGCLRVARLPCAAWHAADPGRPGRAQLPHCQQFQLHGSLALHQPDGGV